MGLGIVLAYLGITSFGLLFLTGIFIFGLYVRYRKFQKVLGKTRLDKPYSNDGPDVIIVGAGIVGSAMAAVLARDGRRVTVIERSMKPPQRIAGEVLTSGALKTLKKLGLNVTSADVDGVRTDECSMYATTDDVVQVPIGCITLDNGKLVNALRQHALNETRCNVIEGNVLHLCIENRIVTGVEYREKTHEESKILRAPLTILADGAFSRLRSVNVSRGALPCNYNIGLEVETNNDSTSALIPTSIGVLLWYPLGPKRLRFIIATDQKRERTAIQNIVEEAPKSVREDFKQAADISTIRTSPVFYLPPSMKHTPGVITIGDALSIRNAIGASGMTVGLGDVATWRSLLQGIPDLYNYNALFAAENIFALERKRYSFVLDLLSWCLRNFFIPQSDGLKQLGTTLGEYIKTIIPDYGNMYTGLDTRPQLLLYHLAKVTMIAMRSAISANGLCGLPRGLYQAVQAFCSSFATIVPHIHYQIKSMIVTK